MSQIDIKVPTVTRALADSRNGVDRYEVADSRAKGLRLRVSAGQVIWQFRFMMDKKPTRLTLGSVDTWTIAEARQLVSDASVVIRGKIRRPDEAWVAEQLVAHGKVEAPAEPEPVPHTPATTWTWEQAKTEFLAEVERTLHVATWRDYRNRLGIPELNRFAGRPVAGITRKEMAVALADIFNRGVPSQAEHARDVIKSMWKFLSLDRINDNSGVELPVMVGLRSPERSKLGEVRKKRYIPPILEVGRVMAIAQSGAVDERIGLAIQHLIYTCQRVLPISRTRRDAIALIENKSEALWSMSAAHRKTADKRGDEGNHVVPLPSQAYKVIKRAMDMTGELDHVRVFPAYRARRVGMEADAMATSAIQHNLSYMPGITATPHDFRRSFSNLGAAKFG